MTSSLEKQFVFVVGAPRSGTTWLHRMLAEHPSVASLNAELTLFSSYVARVLAQFDKETYHRKRGDWKQGLPLLFTQEEFDSGIRKLTGMTYDRVLAKAPGASHILDKHPGYSLHIPVIDRVLPNSRFIHILRDGREVAVSMMSAKKRIGFGEGEIRGAAEAWATHVRKAMAEGHKLGPSRYMEVRYEELMERPERILNEIFDFAGLPLPETEILRIATEHAIDKKQVSRGDITLNELRKVPGAIWRNKLSLEERWTMDRMVGDLLVELGFAKPGWWVLKASDKLQMAGYPALKKIGNILGSAKHIISYPLVKRLEP